MISNYDLSKLMEYWQFQKGDIAVVTFEALAELRKLRYERKKERKERKLG